MKVIKKIARRLKTSYKKLIIFIVKKSFIRDVKNIKKRQAYANVTLSKTQIKEIQNYFLQFYGKKIPLYWHKYYMSFTGNLDVEFFPEHLFIAVLEEKLNPLIFRQIYEDKNHLHQLFNNIDNVVMPLTYLSRTNGFYRTNTYEIISKFRAEEIIQNLQSCFLKPTLNSNSGKNCFKFNLENIEEAEKKVMVEKILNFSNDFVVQEIIKPHESLKILNPSSLNCFRIITLLLENGVIYVAPSILKMGIGNSIIDNLNAGGIFVGIDTDGFLQEKAFGKYGDKYIKHPTSNIPFANYQINLFPEVLKAVKKLHSRIPHCRMASWDLTINNENKIVLIEVNLTGQSTWLSQIAWGKSIFGEHTKYLLKEIYKQ